MSLSPESLLLLQPFAEVFTRPTLCHIRTLVYATLLTSGRRTLAAALRAMGRGDERHFTTYHRVLNRAVWSPFDLSRILLRLLVGHLSRLVPLSDNYH
jgi:DDE superfamily endonuclease